MFFKNLMVYVIDPDFELDLEALDEALGKHEFRSCTDQMLSSTGWVPPLGKDTEALAHRGAGFALLQAKTEERLLPAAVIREAVAERVETIEDAEDRKVSSRQRRDLREAVIFDMTPRAFRRSRHTRGLVLADAGYIIVDAVGWKKAEDWISLLRVSLGSLPVTPVETESEVSGVLSGWLSGKIAIPAGVDIGEECEMKSPHDGGAVVRCRNQDLLGEEIRAHLKTGKRVTKLSLGWNESLDFVLGSDLEIRRVRFSDTLSRQVKDEGHDDERAELDAAATLMALEYSRFLPALWSMFGGAKGLAQ